MANRNKYSRTKEGRASIASMREKYPWLSSTSPVMQLMRRKYSHPDEVMLAINESYDGDIPDSVDGFGDFLSNAESPYNAFVNDAWDMLTQHGPMTLESVESYLPTADFNEGSAERVEKYIEELMGGADYDDNEDSDMILSNYSGPMEYDDRFLAYEDTLTDLFDDARKVATSRKLFREAKDSKESWLDKLYNKRNKIDSNGDTKGADGLAGTKDDRGTASKDNSGELCDNCGGDGTINKGDKGYAGDDDTYGGTGDNGAGSGDDDLDDDDDAQNNILNALLQHSL